MQMSLGITHHPSLTTPRSREGVFVAKIFKYRYDIPHVNLF